MSQLNNEILNKIITQISEVYVRNDCPAEFIERHNGRIPLNQYLCFTYGTRQNTKGRVVEVLYFLSKSHVANQIPYEVALWNRDTSEYECIWVENTGVLRKDFLGFTKKTHLFRNTFLYDPISTNIYRLHELKPYLHLPFKLVCNCKIYTSNTNYYIGLDYEDNSLIEDTAIVPKSNKYKQILDLCDELNRLVNSCH